MDGNNNSTSQEDENITNNKKRKYPITKQNKAGPSTSDNAGPCAKEKFEYEPAPTKRNRIARKLVQKMRHIIYEYSVKTGEQITGVFIDKPNALTRDYKIYGTQPLVSVMDGLKCSIDDKFRKILKDERKTTFNSIRPGLPLLTIDGVITKLEYFTQSQLRTFIPHLIKYSTGRHHTGWTNPSLKPVWWPKDLGWFNVRYDMRTTEQKSKETWSNTLRRIIMECYKYYGQEEMLQGHEFCPSILPETEQNPIECVASTSTDQSFEVMEVHEPVLIESDLTYQDIEIIDGTPTIEFTGTSSPLHNNVMYLLQSIGPSTSLLHPIHVMPVQTINLENTNSICDTLDLMDSLKQTTNGTAITQLNDVEIINETCVSTISETSANI